MLTYVRSFSSFRALLLLFVDFEFQTTKNSIINEFCSKNHKIIDIFILFEPYKIDHSVSQVYLGKNFVMNTQ